MAKIGVVLAGCGNMDGAEIHEATLTLLHLDRLGAEILCLAPDRDMVEVMDHAKRKPMREKRNILTEAARIARGKIRDVAQVKVDDVDGVIFAGGFGAARNFSEWPEKGAAAKVLPDIERLIRDVYAATKPLGFICIAPVLAGLVLGGEGVHLTIGKDPKTASELEKCGAVHEIKDADEICVDEAHRIVSTPAYMLAPSIAPVSRGVEKLVAQILAWAK